jgi:hypothetical protein
MSSFAMSRRVAALSVLLLLPLLLRLAPIGHGDGRNYVPDTHIVRSALGMAQDKDLAPPAGKYSNYPYLLPYLLLPIYAGEYALGKAAGEWDNPAGFAAAVAKEPGRVHLPARVLIALFGAASAWVAYRAARAMGLGVGAWVASLLIGTSLLHLHFSVQERPWVPVGFFLLCSAWACALWMQEARFRHLALGCVSAGLAFACHQSGLAVFALPGLAWLLHWLREPQGRWSAQLLRGAGGLALGLLAALLLGHAYYLTHGASERVILADKLAAEGGFEVGGVGVIFGMRGESALRMLRALFGYDPLILLLGLGGIWLALKQALIRPVAIFALLWGGFFLFYESDHVRYLLPLVLCLAFPAALCAERWMARAGGVFCVGFFALLPLVQCVRFVHVMRQTDTRALAEDRLRELPAGTTIAIDRYGPEPELSRQALARLTTLRNSLLPPEGLRAREENRKRRFERGELAQYAGIDAIAVGELFEIDERAHRVNVRKGLESLGPDVGQTLHAVGAKQFLHVRRRMGAEDYDAFEELLRGKELLWSIDPRKAGRGGEALLPTEMEFPLTGIWRVERPGPVMRTYRLPD